MRNRKAKANDKNSLLALIPAEIHRETLFEPPNLGKARAKFEKTGTAEVVTGKHYGVCIKDEGDFVSVRFGSNELTEIGSVPYGERNFATSDEAFLFAEQIQDLVRKTLRRKPVGTSARVSLVADNSD